MEKLELNPICRDYRPIPFWSWNDQLEEQELRRQIREMKNAGMGGFFMHARGGLKTAYLNAEWMKCVNACLDEAQKVGLDGWLYDENGWPSGFGGGLVCNLGEKYQQKYLRFEVIEAREAAGKPQTIAFYTSDGLQMLEQCPDSGQVMRAFYEVNQFYVDNLDAEVVAEFIRVTHQYYYQEIPVRLRNAMRGIFTDEPQLSRNGIPWSLTLPAAYEENYHCSLLAELPAMQFSRPGSRAVRVRYWRLCAQLFNRNFLKQIHDVCRKYQWELTGHHVLEESCEHQIPANGSVMLQYQHYDMPGIDHLGRGYVNLTGMIQLTSAAMQFGRRRLLTESFACTGWNFNFSGMKWMYQSQLVQGINVLCQHLQSYSLRGARKRDYPASFFHHQPWWPDVRILHDYFSRCGMVLAKGENPVTTLVIHSLSSGWVHCDGSYETPAVRHYTGSLQTLTTELQRRNIPHHFADECIVEELVGCKTAADTTQGSWEQNAIRIGVCRYNFVLIPQISNLSSIMLHQLRTFSEHRGFIGVVRNRLEHEILTIDGMDADEETLCWFHSLPHFADETAAADFAAQQGRSIGEAREHGVLCPSIQIARRFYADGVGYFLVSKEYNLESRVQLQLPVFDNECVDILDLTNGVRSNFSGYRIENGQMNFEYDFAPGEALMLFASRKINGAHSVATTPLRSDSVTEKPFEPAFTLSPGSGDNFLTLDQCRYQVDDEEWIKDDVSVIHHRLLQLKHSCRLTMVFEFDADSTLENIRLVIETPERFRIWLDDRAIVNRDCGFIFDSAFRTIRLGDIGAGHHEIRLETDYFQRPEVYRDLECARKFEGQFNKLSFDSEIENIYLTGDFLVFHQGTTEALHFNAMPSDALTIPVNCTDAVRCHGQFTLHGGMSSVVVDSRNLIFSGLPFFAGKCLLQQEFELTESEAATLSRLAFEPRGGNGYRIILNGDTVGTLFYPPYQLMVGNKLRAGINHLQIEITTSLRNLLGPFHDMQGESHFVWPLSFHKGANVIGWQGPEYHPGYCFVALGLQKLRLE